LASAGESEPDGEVLVVVHAQRSVNDVMEILKREEGLSGVLLGGRRELVGAGRKIEVGESQLGDLEGRRGSDDRGGAAEGAEERKGAGMRDGRL
jgi:hypothetical protein